MGRYSVGCHGMDYDMRGHVWLGKESFRGIERSHYDCMKYLVRIERTQCYCK